MRHSQATACPAALMLKLFNQTLGQHALALPHGTPACGTLNFHLLLLAKDLLNKITSPDHHCYLITLDTRQAGRADEMASGTASHWSLSWGHQAHRALNHLLELSLELLELGELNQQLLPPHHLLLPRIKSKQ